MELYKTNIPFDKSKFTIEKFIANENTPARAVKKIILNLNLKIQAAKGYEFNKRRKEIDLKEKEEKLCFAEGFEKERLLIDIEEIKFNMEVGNKLYDDCLYEIKVYQHLLAHLPKFNRDTFERDEEEYWVKRLMADTRREVMQCGRIEKGTLESLEKIGITIGKDEKGQLKFNNLPQIEGLKE